MIRQLSGEVAAIEPPLLVITVGGIGYAVSVPTIPPDTAVGSTVVVHTYLAVRETALDLYGFFSRDELEVFELLLTLPKVGPKSALQILAQTDLDTLSKAIMTSDPSYLTKVSGIGKKTAEKIVHELAEKFTDRVHAPSSTPDTATSTHADIIDALVTLGYPLSDARLVAQSLPPNLSANDAIKEALRVLSSH